jgi:hypothetical protein
MTVSSSEWKRFGAYVIVAVAVAAYFIGFSEIFQQASGLEASRKSFGWTHTSDSPPVASSITESYRTLNTACAADDDIPLQNAISDCTDGFNTSSAAYVAIDAAVGDSVLLFLAGADPVNDGHEHVADVNSFCHFLDTDTSGDVDTCGECSDSEELCADSTAIEELSVEEAAAPKAAAPAARGGHRISAADRMRQRLERMNRE